jgi:hypothetical protein
MKRVDLSKAKPGDRFSTRGPEKELAIFVGPNTRCDKDTYPYLAKLPDGFVSAYTKEGRFYVGPVLHLIESPEDLLPFDPKKTKLPLVIRLADAAGALSDSCFVVGSEGESTYGEEEKDKLNAILREFDKSLLEVPNA